MVIAAFACVDLIFDFSSLNQSLYSFLNLSIICYYLSIISVVYYSPFLDGVFTHPFISTPACRKYLYKVVLLPIFRISQISPVESSLALYRVAAVIATFFALSLRPFGRPPIFPLALADANPAFVRSLMISLSFSAKIELSIYQILPSTWKYLFLQQCF
jgi:hypothetical protein